MEALRDPQRRRAIEEGGGDYDYTDCFEMLGDMVALRRALPDATILANDNPLEQRLGYIAYWLREGDEVVVYFGMSRMALENWTDPDAMRAGLLRDAFKTADGRMKILREVERRAAQPAPAEEVHRPSVWERLMADDDD